MFKYLWSFIGIPKVTSIAMNCSSHSTFIDNCAQTQNKALHSLNKLFLFPLARENISTLTMSTFSGFIKEIDGISVDRFTKLNFQSRVFFLSHCHVDHMVGLGDLTPENQLPGPLYLSEISLEIVKKKFPAITNVYPLKTGGE